MPVVHPASTPTIAAAAARRLFLGAQGLLDDPARRADSGSVYRLVERLGFVQIDSIRIVERAQHLILAARLDGYRPQHLGHLLETDRRLFEHWTHDAAAVPSAWFPYWRTRFERHRRLLMGRPWWRERLGGEPEKLADHVRQRIAREGPLQSKDFEHDRKGEPGGWWGWKPQKAVLEYLWHTGELAITRRVHFQKVYDLTERVLPHVVQLPAPDEDAHTDWAARSALDRLGIATAGEIAAFWKAIDPAVAKAWCAAAVARGEIVAVQVADARGGRPQPAFARADWEKRLRRLPEAPDRMRVLAPFDPILHDRKRTRRLFGFEYSFEAFVPAAKRRYGYYVLPLLEGDRLVGRIDPALRRTGTELFARRVWWEPGVRPTRARRAALAAALERLAACVGLRG